MGMGFRGFGCFWVALRGVWFRVDFRGFWAFFWGYVTLLRILCGFLGYFECSGYFGAFCCVLGVLGFGFGFSWVWVWVLGLVSSYVMVGLVWFLIFGVFGFDDLFVGFNWFACGWRFFVYGVRFSSYLIYLGVLHGGLLDCLL